MLCELAAAFRDGNRRPIAHETSSFRTGGDPVDELVGHASN